MAKNSEIARLQIQKRLLIAKSEIHRQTMQLELQQIRESTAWIGKTISVVKTSLPFLAVGAPVAGYFVAKKRSGLKTGFQKAGWLLAAFKQVKSFLAGFNSVKTGNNYSEEEQFSEHFRPG